MRATDHKILIPITPGCSQGKRQALWERRDWEKFQQVRSQTASHRHGCSKVGESSRAVRAGQGADPQPHSALGAAPWLSGGAAAPEQELQLRDAGAGRRTGAISLGSS